MKGDIVKVIAGDDRGKVGKVVKVLRKLNRIVVKGVNINEYTKSKSHFSQSFRIKSRDSKNLLPSISQMLAFTMTPSKKQWRCELLTILRLVKSSGYRKKLVASYIKPGLRSIKERREAKRESWVLRILPACLFKRWHIKARTLRLLNANSRSLSRRSKKEKNISSLENDNYTQLARIGNWGWILENIIWFQSIKLQIAMASSFFR